jgi:hypothetical protein
MDVLVRVGEWDPQDCDTHPLNRPVTNAAKELQRSPIVFTSEDSEAATDHTP